MGLDFSDDKKQEGEGYIYGYPGEVQINGKEVTSKKSMYGMKGEWIRH